MESELKILFGLVVSGRLDPSDYSVFQAVFGMIFPVIIALEFKKSLLVAAGRRDTVVQIRSVVVINFWLSVVSSSFST